MLQIRRYVFKIRNSNGKNYSLRGDRLASVKPKHIAARSRLYAGHELFFQIGHHFGSESESVFRERLQPHRCPHIGIRNTAFCTEFLQSKLRTGSINV